MATLTLKGVGDMGVLATRGSPCRLKGPATLDFVRTTFNDVSDDSSADSSVTTFGHIHNINEPWKNRQIFEMAKTGITGASLDGTNMRWINPNPVDEAMTVAEGEELVVVRTADDQDKTQWLLEIGYVVGTGTP